MVMECREVTIHVYFEFRLFFRQSVVYSCMQVVYMLYGALMIIHVVVGLVPVKHFDHEGLHQLQNVL